MTKPFFNGEKHKNILNICEFSSSFSEIVFSGKYFFPLHFKCGTEKSQFVITLHTLHIGLEHPILSQESRGRAKGVNWD